MKKILKIFAIIIGMISLTGCEMTMSSEDMIEPPLLETKNEEIRNLVKESIPENAKLVNLESDEGISGIKMVDLNANGKKEIISFFSSEDKDKEEIGVMILEEHSGVYKKYRLPEIYGATVNKVQFENITQENRKDIILSMVENISKILKLNIYSLEEDEYNMIWDRKFTYKILEDLTGNGNIDILIYNYGEKEGFLEYHSYSRQTKKIEFVDQVVISQNTDITNMEHRNSKDGRKEIVLTKSDETELVFFINKLNKLEKK